jgi:hypothetical protein
MSFDFLDEKKKLTKLYADEGMKFCKKVEDTILQNDKSAFIEEKIASIGMAAIFMWIVGFFITMTGIGIILFIIGLLLSKLINNKVYGKERKIENISPEEKSLIDRLAKHSSELKGLKMKVGIKSQYKAVLLTDFGEKRKKMTTLFSHVNSLDTKHLTLKYRANYRSLSNAQNSMNAKLNDAYQIKQQRL